jgi:hypothetical protein
VSAATPYAFGVDATITRERMAGLPLFAAPDVTDRPHRGR